MAQLHRDIFHRNHRQDSIDCLCIKCNLCKELQKHIFNSQMSRASHHASLSNTSSGAIYQSTSEPPQSVRPTYICQTLFQLQCHHVVMPTKHSTVQLKGAWTPRKLITLLSTMPVSRCNKRLDGAHHDLRRPMRHAFWDEEYTRLQVSTTLLKARDQTCRIDMSLADNLTVCAANTLRQEL